MGLVFVIMFLILPGLLFDLWNRFIPPDNNDNHQVKPSHPEPHRDPKTGKIVIENNLLYQEDLRKYGAVQTMRWVKEGKYNLTPEELKKEHERLKAKYEQLYKL